MVTNLGPYGPDSFHDHAKINRNGGWIESYAGVGQVSHITPYRMGEIGRVDQCFARNTTNVQTVTTEQVFFDQGYLGTDTRSTRGGDETGLCCF